jgi:hypothetical protein
VAGRRPPPDRPDPDPAELRWAEIYVIPVYDFDPRTGLMLPPDPETGLRRIRCDYVGQTVRGADIREAEHADDKPWFDLAAGPAQTIESGWWTKQDRDDREIAAIARIRPRFNHDHNLANPERIPIWDPRRQQWVQIAHRHARDVAAGRPLWLTPQQRQAALDASLAVQEARRRLADRTPGEFAWDVLAVVARWVTEWPRWAHLVWAGFTLWVLAGWAAASALTAAGWPGPASTVIAAAGPGALLLAALRSRAVQAWARRKRRRRRR